MTQASSGLLGRTDNYSAPYTVQRSSYSSPHSRYNELSRYSQYAANPRAIDTPNSSFPGTMYNHPSNMLLDPSSRSPQPTTEAPPFFETTVIHSIVTTNNQTIKPEIQAKIHKGFFQVDEKWTCYRRNYFAVSCSFSLRPWIPNVPLYLQLPNHTTENIRSFSMSISAVVNGQDNEIRELVQHTPKRDKQSERKPGKATLQPNQPPSLVLNHGPVVTPSHLAFGAPPTTSIRMDYNHSYPTAPQPSQPPTQHTFERIQFQKATANNGKRRAQQQYYNLVVELYAEISTPIGNGVDAHWVKIARKLSHPMVVRGRSPGHYKDGRRDSSTSMGPDGGAGSSGDGNGGASLQPGMGHASRSHLPLMPYDPTQRGNSQYGRGDYRHMVSTEHSGSSDSPLVSSSSSSSGFEYTIMNDSLNPMETVEDTETKDYCGDTFSESQDVKMDMQSNGIRMHPVKFDFDTVSKSQDLQGGRFGGTFEPPNPSMQNGQESQLQCFKRAGSDESLTHGRRPAPGHGFSSLYTRDLNDKGYGRLDAINNFHELCS
jgi:meiosis-specific transcription factor NDT80